MTVHTSCSMYLICCSRGLAVRFLWACQPTTSLTCDGILAPAGHTQAMRHERLTCVITPNHLVLWSQDAQSSRHLRDDCGLQGNMWHRRTQQVSMRGWKQAVQNLQSITPFDINSSVHHTQCTPHACLFSPQHMLGTHTSSFLQASTHLSCAHWLPLPPLQVACLQPTRFDDQRALKEPGRQGGRCSESAIHAHRTHNSGGHIRIHIWEQQSFCHCPCSLALSPLLAESWKQGRNYPDVLLQQHCDRWIGV